jgi:hypothetical protein
VLDYQAQLENLCDQAMQEEGQDKLREVMDQILWLLAEQQQDSAPHRFENECSGRKSHALGDSRVYREHDLLGFSARLGRSSRRTAFKWESGCQSQIPFPFGLTTLRVGKPTKLLASRWPLRSPARVSEDLTVLRQVLSTRGERENGNSTRTHRGKNPRG